MVAVAMTCSVALRRPERASGSAHGQLDLRQHLPPGHAHAPRRVAGGGVDAVDAGVDAGQQRRHREQHEHDDARDDEGEVALDERARRTSRRRRAGRGWARRAAALAPVTSQRRRPV